MSENTSLPEYDKSQWARGEWDNEPDRVDFVHAGFSCFILRNHLGSWCGYVGVPSSHPYYEKDYDDCDVDVHGGLTYAAKCGSVVCHIPEKDMPDDVWWLGFDTGHYMDLSPSIEGLRSKYPHDLGGYISDEIYRNVEYVTNETKQLAEQLEKLNDRIP